jgi:hypothetical protein
VLKLRETTSESGELVSAVLRVSGERLEIVEGPSVLAVPIAALEAIMNRYGAPFDPTARISRVSRLELGDSRSLQHVRHLAGYDVIARDYLVYESASLAEPLCALATTVAGALAYLARP